MSRATKVETIVGTFADPHAADLAMHAVCKAGFHVERRSGTALAVETGQHPVHADEIRGILGAYGAREYPSTTQTETESDQHAHLAHGARLDVVEEELRPRTRLVQSGEVTIRKEVVTETRTIAVPITREELVIEHHPVNRQPLHGAEHPSTADDPLIAQLVDRLRHMPSGETLRIPVIEEEVVVHKRPVVVEEITLRKRTVSDSEKVSDTVRREQVHVDKQGDVQLHDRS